MSHSWLGFRPRLNPLVPLLLDPRHPCSGCIHEAETLRPPSACVQNNSHQHLQHRPELHVSKFCLKRKQFLLTVFGGDKTLSDRLNAAVNSVSTAGVLGTALAISAPCTAAIDCIQLSTQSAPRHACSHEIFRTVSVFLKSMLLSVILLL